MNQTAEDPSVALSRIIIGYTLSQAVYVASKLGVPDLLASGPRDGADLARATNTHAQSLSRVLRLLAANEVLAEVAPDRAGVDLQLDASALVSSPGWRIE
jgi:Dimerisation domain